MSSLECLIGVLKTENLIKKPLLLLLLSDQVTGPLWSGPVGMLILGSDLHHRWHRSAMLSYRADERPMMSVLDQSHLLTLAL